MKNEYVLASSAGIRSAHLRRDDIDAFHDALLADPDGMMNIDEPITRGNSSTTGRIEFQAQSYFLKRYEVSPRTLMLRKRFRKTPVMREWLTCVSYFELGLPVPRPLLCLQRLGHLRRPRVSCLLLELLEGYEGLDTLWSKLSSDEQGQFIERLSGVMHRVYAAGAHHRDLQWRNILVRRSGEGMELRLIDLIGNRTYRAPTPAGRRRRDCIRFLYFIDQHDVTDQQLHGFRQAFQ